MAQRSQSTRFRPAKLRSGPSFAQALERLRGGGRLSLTYFQNKPVWEIDGWTVSPEIISLLLASHSVVPDGDALIPDMPSQSCRRSRWNGAAGFRLPF
jgi:hypothetical protein